MGGGWLCLTGLTSLYVCVLPASVCKGAAPPFRSSVTSRCRSEEAQGTAQCRRALPSWWRSIFQALLPLGSHKLKQLRNSVFVLSGVIKTFLPALLLPAMEKSYFSGTRVLCIPGHSHRFHPQGSRILHSHSCRRWSSWVPSGPGCRCCHSGCLRTQSHTLEASHNFCSAHWSKECSAGLTPHSLSEPARESGKETAPLLSA